MLGKLAALCRHRLGADGRHPAPGARPVRRADGGRLDRAVCLGVGLFIVGSLALGFPISTVARTQLQAMQMTFFFFLPSILLSGFMFPFRGMPGWAQWIGEAIPVTHFLRVVRGALLKGQGARRTCGANWWR